MDGTARNPAGPLPAVAGPSGQDDKELTGAAELYIGLIPVYPAVGQQDGADGPGSRRSVELRRFGPAAVQMGIRVPPAQASQLLRVFERVVPWVTWQATVIGSLFGAAAAHLPPAGTTAVVVLEIVTPPLLLRGRQRNKDKDK